MSALEMRSTFHATSAAGPMRSWPAQAPVVIGCLLEGLGTSMAYPVPSNVVLRTPKTSVQTTAGSSISPSAPACAAIGELRRLSGLTWDQLARLFDVSRRSLHFWASGKAMTQSNEEHLQRILAIVRKIDRGSASANRALLLGARADGSIPFDLLGDGAYERVLSLLGPGEGRRASPPRPAAEVRAARAPQPPDELVGALQDRIHQDGGAARPAKSVRVRSGD